MQSLKTKVEEESQTRHRELEEAWADFANDKSAFLEERDRDKKSLREKKNLLESRDCFWYMTGAKLRSCVLVALGVIVSLVVMQIANLVD